MDNTSALSGRTMKQLAANGDTYQSARSKANDPPVPSPRAILKDSKRKISKTSGPPVISTEATKGRETSRIKLTKFIAPMKARLVENPPAGDWIYEIKFDGFRALAFKTNGEVRLLSRNEKDMGAQFSEVRDAVRELKINDAIIDGEIVALDEKGRSSFQALQRFELGESRPPIFYYAFDLLELNGKDLTREPVIERKAQLEKMLNHAPAAIRYSSALGEDAEALLPKIRKLQLEGLIGKRKDSAYEPGRRSGAWIKLKLVQEQEMVIGGYTDPGGSRQHLGALLLGYHEDKKLKFAGKVGTGFTQAILKDLGARFQLISSSQCPFANLPEKKTGQFRQNITAAEMKRCHWLKPNLVCQVKFYEWTQDGKLRQPVYMGLRHDKPASQVIRERPAAA
jgi:bifunctional non-homologous end joining protein LigD